MGPAVSGACPSGLGRRGLRRQNSRLTSGGCLGLARSALTIARVAAPSLRASGPLRRRDSGGTYRGIARIERTRSHVPALLNPLLRYPSFMDAHDAHAEQSMRMELQEAIGTYRHWISQLTQLTGFFLAANGLLLGYGFSQKIAGILLVASFAPVFILIMYLVILTFAGPVISLILRLERKLKIREDSLGATFVRVHYIRSEIPPPGIIEDLSDEQVRDLNLTRPWQDSCLDPIPIILYVCTVAQIGLFVASLTVFHYRFM